MVSALDADSKLTDAGLDSLGAMDLVTRLQKLAGVDLPAVLLYDAPTARAVSQVLSSTSTPAETIPPMVQESTLQAQVTVTPRIPNFEEALESIMCGDLAQAVQFARNACHYITEDLPAHPLKATGLVCKRVVHAVVMFFNRAHNTKQRRSTYSAANTLLLLASGYALATPTFRLPPSAVACGRFSETQFRSRLEFLAANPAWVSLFVGWMSTTDMGASWFRVFCAIRDAFVWLFAWSISTV